MNFHEVIRRVLPWGSHQLATRIIEELNDNGYYIAPLEQRPHDSTVYRDGEMRVM